MASDAGAGSTAASERGGSAGKLRQAAECSTSEAPGTKGISVAGELRVRALSAVVSQLHAEYKRPDPAKPAITTPMPLILNMRLPPTQHQ